MTATSSSTSCQACGAPLPPSRGNRPRKWCSDRCRKQQYMKPCVDCGRLRGRHGELKHTRCRECGLKASKATINQNWTPQRQKLADLYLAGVSYREIAERMSYAESNYKNTVAIAVRRLRSYGFDLPYRRHGPWESTTTQ